jgi:hypothetical protein
MDGSTLRRALTIQPLTSQYFRDVIPADLLPSKSEQRGIYIVNTHEHHQPGEHWVTIDFGDDSIYYFDPLGLPPHPTILRHLRKSGVRSCIPYNDRRFQGMRNTCGLYCLYQILCTVSSLHNMSVFNDDLDFNDRLVHKLTSNCFSL